MNHSIVLKNLLTTDDIVVVDNNNVPVIHRKNIRLGKCLGKGGFSKVYTITRLCERQQRQILLLPNTKKLAFKVLRQSTIQRQNKEDSKLVLWAVKDMINEIKLLSLFHHNNIVNIYGFCCNSHYDDDRSPPLAINPTSFKNMGFIIDQVDCTLDDRISTWQYEQQQQQLQARRNNNKNKRMFDKHIQSKVSIALQIIDALKYLHHNGYIYRDLKPANIGLNFNVSSASSSKTKDKLLVDDHNNNVQVKIFDFGLCRKLPLTTTSSSCSSKQEQFYNMSLVGSEQYMAPEIYHRQPYNTKVDVYSWSIVFYTMLTLCNNNNNNNPVVVGSSSSSYFQISSSLLQTMIQDSCNSNPNARPTMEQLSTGLGWYYKYAFDEGNNNNNKAKFESNIKIISPLPKKADSTTTTTTTIITDDEESSSSSSLN